MKGTSYTPFGAPDQHSKEQISYLDDRNKIMPRVSCAVVGCTNNQRNRLCKDHKIEQGM